MATEGDVFRLVGVLYSPVGQIMTVDGQSRRYIAFNYETSEIVTLPDVENESRRYFELLPDGSVLFYRRDNETRTELGIWIYDPADETIPKLGGMGAGNRSICRRFNRFCVSTRLTFNNAMGGFFGYQIC